MNGNVIAFPMEAFFRDQFGERAYAAINGEQASRLHHPTAGAVLSETVAVMRRKETT